jgi:hypothetical protein
MADVKEGEEAIQALKAARPSAAPFALAEGDAEEGAGAYALKTGRPVL